MVMLRELGETLIAAADMSDTYPKLVNDLTAAKLRIAVLSRPPRPAFTVNPAFVPPVGDIWYDALHTAIRSTKPDPDVRMVALTGTAETIGFTVKSYVTALAHALDHTGDPALLTEIVSVMHVIRTRPTPIDGLNIDKYRAFLASLYALVGYLCHLNRAHDPSYADAADYWLKEYARVFGGSIPSDNLTHAYVASMETAWLMYLIGGGKAYRGDCERKYGIFRSGVAFTDDSRVLWDHRPPFAITLPKNGIQPTDYARYVVESLVTLERLGMHTLPMDALANMALRCIPETGTISWTMDGLGGNDKAKIETSNWSLLARFDASGELRKRVIARHRENVIYVAAGLV